MSAVPTAAPNRRLTPLLVLGVGLAALLWSYWPTLTGYFHIWTTNPSYSHGWLVPIFAVALLWLRRDQLAAGDWQGSYWGWAVLAAGVALRLFEAAYKFERGEYSILLCLAGVFLLVGGWKVWRWAWPSVLFVVFMIPLPWTIEQRMPLPLQDFATDGSTFVLQTIGLTAVSEGHNIYLSGEKPLEVAEACSGLHMLMIFFALSTAVALVIKRPIWERVVIVCSALPIALAANIIRISLTGVLLEFTASESIHELEHDMAGLAMMPIALAMLGAEFWLLRYLQEPVPAKQSKFQPARMAPKTVAAAAPAPRTAAAPLPPKAAPPAAKKAAAAPATPKTATAVPPPPRPTTSWFPVTLPAVPPILARRQNAVSTEPPTPAAKPTVAAKPPASKHTVLVPPQTAAELTPTVIVQKPVAIDVPKPAAVVPPKPVAVVAAKPVVAATPKPAAVPPKPVAAVQPPPAVEPPPRPVKKVTAAPKPVEPTPVEAPATPRRARKPWQPAKSSVAAGQPTTTDGTAA